MSSKELLEEYTKLTAKLEHINETLQEMNAVDIAQLIDKMRTVERKMGLVYTLFKSSVYSVTMQDQGQEEQTEKEESFVQHERRRSSIPGSQNNLSSSVDQSFQLQQQQTSQFRRSLSGTNDSTNINYNSARRQSQTRSSIGSTLASRPAILRVSNANAAREELQTISNTQPSASSIPSGSGHGLRMSNFGRRSVLSVSRGYSSSRWSQAPIRGSDYTTNRPRF